MVYRCAHCLRLLDFADGVVAVCEEHQNGGIEWSANMEEWSPVDAVQDGE